MDFSNLLENFEGMACVLSVDTYEDGTYGNILVATGNKAFKDDIENLTKHPFVDNSPYYLSLPKDLNFEDFIHRCAVLHQPLHTYVNLYEMGLWVDMYLWPLKSDKKNTEYCIYSFTISAKANETSMSDLSPETSSLVLSSCIKLRSSEDFIQTINEITSDIRDLCNSFRCSIITIDNENETCEVIGDAHMPGYPSFLRTAEIRKEFYKLVVTWEKTLSGSTCLIIKNEHEMEILKERNPEWYKSLTDHHVESLVLFPLKYKGSILGYIWATNFDIMNAVKIKEVLEVTTFFIASEIANYQMLKKLEILGTIDSLTGTLNRNSMNNRVSQFDQKKDESIKTLGVIFADLNGLKMINDRKGHTEGDRLLKKASAVLRQVFVDDEIYRAGGDEFMVIVLNSSKEEFEEKTRKIFELAGNESNVSFAVGSAFQEGELDIRKALRKADELMYEDKNQFYVRHPELKYR